MRSFALLITVCLTPVVRGKEPAEPLLRALPPGVIVLSSNAFRGEQTKAFERKFGGEIQRITNSVVRLHGRPIQINVITAPDAANAKTIHSAFAQVRQYPFVMQKGQFVVEFAKTTDAALAVKASYELGVQRKPDRVRYRVRAELAAVDMAEYMSCNPLFNLFLAAPSNEPARRQIEDLSKGFKFGRTLVLRNPELARGTATYRFEPTATKPRKSAGTIAYHFDDLPKRYGVPYVAVELEIDVDSSGFSASRKKPAKALIAATPSWPAADPNVKALARKITAGKKTNEAKAMAILKWLAPGLNIKYSGRTGSRWGTLKVLEQEFGHCWDFSDCFVTLARAAGVPSRQVAGWLYASSGHVWAEYYREGEGWQQVDPTGGGQLPCGIYHIPYFTSEDGEMPIVYVSMPDIEPTDE